MKRAKNSYRRDMQPRTCKACGKQFEIGPSEAPSRFLKRNSCSNKCGSIIRKPLGLKYRLFRKVSKDPDTGCWLWGGSKSADGYGRITVNNKLVGAHRVSFETFVGPIPAGLHVCHKCDTRNCVNPNHLFLGTNAENVSDKVSKGRQSFLRGEQQAGAKLTENQVREIRSSNLSQRKLAAKLGVSQSVVFNVKRRNTWKHVD